jgi:hypothetical protein
MEMEFKSILTDKDIKEIGLEMNDKVQEDYFTTIKL